MGVSRGLTVGGIKVPAFMYGTAWKEDETERLVRLALESGFRAIDTANQRKHYFEAAVGAAVQGAISDGLVQRDELFLQTKFTHLAGQDQRLPYDPDADMATQVRQSFASSLEHLGVETIDSYVLHGPSLRHGLHPDDVAVWDAMQELHAEGKTRLLGVSNVNREQLVELCERGPVPPAFVQHRCYANQGWGAAVREECRERGIIYQGFSLLTANRREQQHPEFRELVERVGLTPAQLIFRFALQVGMLPLTGTTDPVHMRDDLAVFDTPELSEEDLRRVEAIGL